MAIQIKTIPILYGKSAEKFIRTAERNARNPHTIDFSKEYQTYLKIMKKNGL